MKDILTITNLYMGVLFMVIMLLLFIITLIVSVRKKIKYDINYKVYTKNSGITLEECESLLDEFITREFDNYCILNLNYQDIEYVNSTMENEIMKDVINIVQERISDNLIIKMNYFYSKKAISDIIAEKVFILTTSYSLSINLKNNKK